MTDNTQDEDFTLTPEIILEAYIQGIFPMSESAEDPEIFWVRPEKRGIIPLNGFKTSKSLLKSIRNKGFRVEVDTNFDAVISACASVGKDRQETWINQTIKELYSKLFKMGFCHTVEVYQEDQLVGGLYGLAIGGAFFGESMFHTQTDASKAALAHLVERLNSGGFSLLDTQFLTPHLASLGGIEITVEKYEQLLEKALPLDADFYLIDELSAN